MDQEKKLQIEEKIIEMLKTVYDPEIPVDIYSLGLIYKIDLSDDFNLDVDMTLTAPNCPAADFIMEDVRQKLEGITGLKTGSTNRAGYCLVATMPVETEGENHMIVLVLLGAETAEIRGQAAEILLRYARNSCVKE